MNLINSELFQLWAQSVGILAFFASLITFTMKQDKNFIIMMVLVSFLWFIHFGLIWLYAAAFINFVDIFKNILALKYKKNIFITWWVIVLYLIIWALTLRYGYMEIIPVIASLASIYIVFQLSGIQMRLGFLGVVALWFIYNLHWGSWGWVLSDISIFVIWIIWIIRLLRDKKDFSTSVSLPEHDF